MHVPWTAAYGAALSPRRFKILCFILLRVPMDHHFMDGGEALVRELGHFQLETQ